jgi:hypothetical protein
MSLTYVVPVWREEVYGRVTLPWLLHQIEFYGGQLVEVRDAPSIFEAMEEGRLKAKHRFIMYVHDDVRLLTRFNLARHVLSLFERLPRLGLVGPIGKIEGKHVPWWHNKGGVVGHYCRRTRSGALAYEYGNVSGRPSSAVVEGDPHTWWQGIRPRWDRFKQAGMVDGFYLIEDSSRMKQPWDVASYGENWHGYDADRCLQTYALGLTVAVTPWLFLHDNGGHAGYKGSDPVQLNGAEYRGRRIHSEGDALWLADLDKVNKLIRRKWNL